MGVRERLTAMIQSFTSSLSGAVPASGGGTTNFLRADGAWAAPPGGGGSGTVTSVGMTMPAGFTVAGSPVTSAGTLAVSLSSQTAKYALIAPNGANGTPTWRQITASDISGLSNGTVTSVALSAPTGIAVSGSPVTSSGTLTLAWSGTIPAAQLPTFTSSAAGAVPASGGGTLNFLRADGSWSVPAGGGGAAGDITIGDTAIVGGTNGRVLANVSGAVGELVIGADLQAYGANLNALSGLTLVSDRLPYANGSGTLTLATFTAAGRALLDDADAAAQRTTLGLSAVASSGSASDLSTGTLLAARLPALTGDVTSSAGSASTTIASNAVSLAKMATLAANSIIGNNTGSAATPIALTAAQVRTLLGLAASATTDTTVASNITSGTLGIARLPTAAASDWRANTADKVLVTDDVWSAMAEVTLTDAATIAWDMATGFDFAVTLGGNRTLGNPTNTKVGQKGRLTVIQDGTGSRTLAKSSNMKFDSGDDFDLSTTAGAMDIFYYDVRASNFIIISSGPKGAA